jgi:hypothetical protein
MTRDDQRHLLNGTAMLGLIGLIGLLVLGGCRDESYTTVGEDTVIGTEPGSIVNLEGDVERVYSDGFRLDPEDGIINSDGVLVVPPSLAEMPIEGSEVRVRGTLQEMMVKEVESELGFDWAEYEVDFEERGVVVAQAMKITELVD